MDKRRVTFPPSFGTVTEVPLVVIKALGGDHVAAVVVAALHDLGASDAPVQISLDTLCERTGVTVRKLNRARKKLVQRGWVTEVSSRAQGRRVSFRVNGAALIADCRGLA